MSWPSRGPTIQKPILEFKDGELLIHYARVMINPGMEMAGLSLSDQELEALDYLDEVLERPGAELSDAVKAGSASYPQQHRVSAWPRRIYPGRASGKIIEALLDVAQAYWGRH